VSKAAGGLLIGAARVFTLHCCENCACVVNVCVSDFDATLYVAPFAFVHLLHEELRAMGFGGSS
jgi:hypothetical protein